MSRKRNRRSKPSIVKWYHLALLLLGGILVFSMTQDLSPQDSLSNIYHKTIGDSTKIVYHPTELIAEQSALNSRIDSLHEEIKAIENRSPYKEVMVDVESTTVNLRTGPNIASKVIMQIPDSALVDLMSYDTEVLVWEGKTGKWAQISYADTTGWVWGNYLLEKK